MPKFTPTDLTNFGPKTTAISSNLGMLVAAIGATIDFVVTERTVSGL